MNYIVDECIAKLHSAGNVDNLKAIWLSLPKEARDDQAVFVEKNRLKTELAAAELESMTYRLRQVPSRTSPGKFWDVRMLYGGSRDAPPISCSCPNGAFGKDQCWHIKAFLERMSAWDWMYYTHHDDIKNKRWHKIAVAVKKT